MLSDHQEDFVEEPLSSENPLTQPDTQQSKINRTDDREDLTETQEEEPKSRRDETQEERTEDETEEEGDVNAFEFTISDPRRVKNETSKLSFFVYKITGTTTLPIYEHQGYSVERRYSDFEWLRARLVENYAGVIIPPLPEKSMMGTLDKVMSVDSKQLVQYRQRALTKFLVRVCEHPALQKSSHLKQFLTLYDKDFIEVKNTKIKSTTTTSAGIGYLFRKSISQEPTWITNAKKFVSRLEETLKYLKFKLQAMTKTRREMVNSMVDFGKAFKALSTLEKINVDATLSTVLDEVSNHVGNLASLVSTQSEKETITVIETLQYYLGMCESIKQTTKLLEGLRITRDDCSVVVKNLQSALEKISKSGREDKIQKAEEELEKAKQKEHEAQTKLNAAERLFKNDLKRFDEERTVDFGFMLESFVSLQCESSVQVAKHFDEIIPTVEKIKSE
jgi:sorting nexin-1/2